ncbi:MAG: hypothetical protein ACOYL6_17230 [Bacteriovoracaceae bacterium]
MISILLFSLLSFSTPIKAADVTKFKAISPNPQTCSDRKTNVGLFSCWKSIYSDYNQKINEYHDLSYFKLTYDDHTFLRNQIRSWQVLKNQKCKPLPTTILLIHLESMQCHAMMAETKALELEYYFSTLL